MLPLAPADPELYAACRKYTQRFDGDNDSDPATNGELAILRQTMPSCRVVFDAGANVGAWTQSVLALNPAVQIHAFEPSARTFAALEAKGLPASVVLNRLALG